MTLRELLQRQNAHYYSPPVDDGGAPADGELEEFNQETEEEIAAREAQEAEDARIAELVETRAAQLHQERVEQKLTELQARSQPTQPAADPNEAYQERLRQIAFEEDPVRQEELRVQLAEERVASRFQTQLAHSAQEGAASLVMNGTQIPDNVKPYVAKAIRDYRVTPDQVSTPEGIQQVKRIAMGMAAEDGALNPAPAPAPRTPNLRPAPVTSTRQVAGGIMSQLTENEKKAVNAQWMSLPEAMRKGKRIEDVFSETDLAEICADVR